MSIRPEKFPEIVRRLQGILERFMRLWWRQLTGSDETLDKTHLMRLAGRFSRRLRGYARAHGIPVVDCRPGEDKHRMAEEYLEKTKISPGVPFRSRDGWLRDRMSQRRCWKAPIPCRFVVSSRRRTCSSVCERIWSRSP